MHPANKKADKECEWKDGYDGTNTMHGQTLETDLTGESQPRTGR